MRAAIYARFSSDLQNERSITDQVELCRAYAKREGLSVVATFDDRARSGASLIGRDGIIRMMTAALDRQFETVIVESLDRLSRDQEDLAGLWKRLSFAGVDVRTVHEGRADAIQIGVRGLVGALYLKDLAEKVHRGLAGVVRDGRTAGGRAYGYRAVPGRPGQLEIVEAEAKVIRRIFTEYAEGRTPREIAIALNGDGIAPPRGQVWQASTINGNRKRGAGILRTDLYDGRIVWNKVSMIKNPDTGKRVSRPNPPSVWQSVDAPQLRIVDPALWAKVRARHDAAGTTRPEAQRRALRPLSGLVKCGVCGGGMSIKDRRGGRARVQCTRSKEAGTCDNRRPVWLDRIEKGVLGGLESAFSDPDIVATYVDTYRAERKRLAVSGREDRRKAASRLRTVRDQLGRLVDALAEGQATMATVGERMEALEAERKELEARISAAEDRDAANVVELHPAAMRHFLKMVGRLSRDPEHADPEATTAVRTLVEEVRVHPGEPGGDIGIEVSGMLSMLMEDPAQRWGGTMVAEEGLEPPTRGL